MNYISMTDEPTIVEIRALKNYIHERLDNLDREVVYIQDFNSVVQNPIFCYKMALTELMNLVLLYETTYPKNYFINFDKIYERLEWEFSSFEPGRYWSRYVIRELENVRKYLKGGFDEH